MNFKKKLLALVLAIFTVIITLYPTTIYVNGLPEQTRVLVVSKQNNKLETEACLNKYKHIKIKELANYKGAEVVLVDNVELSKIKQESNIQIFEDTRINISKTKEGKRNNKQQIPWGIKRVEADSAWKKTTGKGVKVAVVDSGIAKHEDLIKNIRGEFNAIETDKPATDDFGHGTHVAGIIAASNNKIGVVGIVPDVDLYAVKVLDAYGSGYLSDLVEGIDWCINNGIQIINLSVEVQDDLPLLREAIKRALNSGVIVVAASGNNNGGSTVYPAAYEGVISVSAIDENDNIASFSAIGKVDFTAPGVDILSTYIGDSYTSFSGTSMASPHVTGVLALLLADKRNDLDCNGTVSTGEVKNVMLNYVEDIGTAGYDNLFGNGILKAFKSRAK